MHDPKILERARAIYKETGIYTPLFGTPAGDKAYKLWVEWVSANIGGDMQESEAKALASIPGID